MLRRNWLDLSRKLVDRYDMDQTVTWTQKALGEYANGFWGIGVLPTTFYPIPFPVTMSVVSLAGNSVGNGIAFDNVGNITRIDPGSPAPQKLFTVAAADPLLPRYDLLCIRYKQTGTFPIPKPSDPILTVNLNLIDDFELIVYTGVPNAAPVYPLKQIQDIILAGIQVPAGALLGTDCTVDLGVRENARVNFTERAIFKNVVPTGVVDGTNQVFTIPSTPVDANSLAVYLNGVVLKSTEYALAGTQITMVTAPALGQSLVAFYIELSPTSQNPISGQQETPLGVVDGLNDEFTLSGKPADNESLMVFVDGLKAELDEYALLQTEPNFKVKFAPGSIPAPGQEIYVFYFINAASVGVGIAAPPVSGGSLVPVGSIGTPVVVNPAAGIGITLNQRQVIFVQSSGGTQVVTANPQVAPGSAVGQELALVGVSNINNLVLNDGNGLSLNGPLDLNQNQTAWFVWDGSVWSEISRR
jgi:hypothetical protein